MKFSQGNSDILKATKREVTFNFTEDIYINSDQCKIIVEQKNGCLKDPLASVSRLKSFFHTLKPLNLAFLICNLCLNGCRHP